MSDNQFIVRDTDRGNERPVDSRSKAEEVKQDLEELGATVEIVPPNSTDNSTEIVEHATEESPTEDNEQPQTPAEAVPQPSQLTSDPLDVISKNSEHFTDEIKGQTVINRQGYAVLAERFDISVTAEPVTLPSETDFAYAEFRAVAVTEDHKEYSGFGSAHIDRGDDATLLAELAETRAMKRATAWATGVGMTAVSELENKL